MKAREDFLKKLKQGNFSTPEEMEAAEGLRMLGGENAIRTKLEKVDRRIQRKSPFLNSAFSIAATISLLIIAVSVWWITNTQQKNKEQLAQTTQPNILKSSDSLLDAEEDITQDSVVQLTPEFQVVQKKSGVVAEQFEPAKVIAIPSVPPASRKDLSVSTAQIESNFNVAADNSDDNLEKAKVAEISQENAKAENLEIASNSAPVANGSYRGYSNTNNSNQPTNVVVNENQLSKKSSSKPAAVQSKSDKSTPTQILSPENSCIEKVMSEKKLLVAGEVKSPTQVQVSRTNGKVNIGFKGMENWTSTELTILESAITNCLTLKEGDIKDLTLMLPLKIKLK